MDQEPNSSESASTLEQPQMADAELLRAYVAEGSQPAFAAIMQRYAPLVMGVCRRALHNGAEADDAFQATFFVLARKASSIRNPDSLADWLFGVALRVARKSRVADTRRRSHLERLMEMIRMNPTKPAREASELECELDEQIARLPERHRKVIVLCHMQGLTKREVAAQLGWPEGTIATRLSQAKEMLRERLMARGYGVPAEALGTAMMAAPVPAALCASTLVAATSMGGKAAASAKSVALSDALVRAMNLGRFKAAGVAAGVFCCAIAGAIGVAMATRDKAPVTVGATPPPVAVSQPVQVAEVMPLPMPAAPPTTLPAGVSAAQLVREARDSEAWIEKVKSFSYTADSVWTKPPESIAARKVQLQRQFPNTEITEQRFRDLRPRETDTLLIAFDASRCVKHQVEPDAYDRVQIWDGKKAMGHDLYMSNNNQESYWFDKNTKWFSQFFFLGDTSWPRAARHRFWWSDPSAPGITDLAPDKFEVMGRETYRGIDCWVLNETGYNFGRIYVGVADHLVHSLMSGPMPKNPATDEMLRTFGAEHNQAFKTTQELLNWTKSFSREKGNALFQEFQTRVHRTDRARIEHWMLDYENLPGGGPFPMTQGYIIYDGDFAHRTIQVQRDIKMNKVKVNEALPDELFKMDMKEGVEVSDRLSDPPLIYKYKKNMSAEEWDAVVMEAQKRDDDMKARQAAQDLAVGKAAPGFPPRGQWINSKPLSWADFKGKMVVVDFFAEWCGPCRNDYPTLVQLYKDHEASGITVLGIHTPGSDRAKIDKLMKDYSITYPVFVDLPPPPGAQSFGTLFNAYGVSAIPHSFLIDGNGQVVAHGMLGEVLNKARELKAKSGKAG